MENEKITTDPLFIGIARPRTLLGAPYEFAIIALMLSGVGFLLVKNPLVLSIGIPLIIAGRLLVKYDPYAVQVYSQYALLRSRLLRGSGTWSYAGRRVISVSPWEYHQGNKKRKNK